MKRLIDWFRSWFAIAHYDRRVAAVERTLARLNREHRRVERTLDRREEALTKSGTQMRAALDTARSTIRQYEETTNELRAELRVAALEIETMAASHQKFLKRYDAETAIEVRREVAARPFNESPME